MRRQFILNLFAGPAVLHEMFQHEVISAETVARDVVALNFINNLFLSLTGERCSAYQTMTLGVDRVIHY